jgi:hypothetical protein
MKFTIEDTPHLAAMKGDAGATLTRVYYGTAENGARVRFCVAHAAVHETQQPELTRPVLEYFQRLDEQMMTGARLGLFHVIDGDTETIETGQPKGEA